LLVIFDGIFSDDFFCLAILKNLVLNSASVQPNALHQTAGERLFLIHIEELVFN